MPWRIPERGPAVRGRAGGRATVRYAFCGFIGIAAGLFSGCGTTALRHSFNNYSDVYAETQNRQMLLNLARLHEREPVYFFQLTQITAGYTFTEQLASLQDLNSVGPTPTAANNVHTVSGTLGATATHNPTFTLIPLAGDKFAQQMLAPIKPQVFYELFEEGWPLDLLMRVLIERIELEVPPPEGKGLTILENNPNQWTDGGASDKVNVVQDGPKGYYDRFLRACALAREFQEHGLIYLAEEKSYQSEGPASLNEPDAEKIEHAVLGGLVWRNAGDKASDPAEGHGAPAGGGKAETGPKPERKNGWQLCKVSAKTFFRLASIPGKDGQPAPAEMTKALMDALKGKPCYTGCDQPVDLFAAVVMKGFDVTDDTARGRSTDGTAEGRSTKAPLQVRLVMRSLMGAMAALASEQERFRVFSARFAEEQQKHQAQWQDHSNPKDPANWAPLPDSENHPVLELIYTGKGALGRPVVQLDYAGRHFAIADPISPTVGPPQTWNRDVFRLLIQLSFLATVDPSAFASPSLIQLR